MHLILVESPAKCGKIQGFLGDGWKCIASMGHIRSLEENLEAIGIHRDFEARFQWMKEKAAAIKNIKEAAAEADDVYLAADDDREGEAIAYSVALLLKLDPTKAKRAVFHEITETAVKAAVANPRIIDMNRVRAQEARSILDMMVGFTISPLLWKHVEGKELSAGRCQTPALRLVCEREELIQSFKSETTWQISGSWFSSKGTIQAKMKDTLDDEESALNYLSNLEGNTRGTISAASTKEWSAAPPLPLITSTLQQEASALYSSPPKRTMQIAQKLYEGGHITYMRTDHAILSEEARANAVSFVVKECGDAYVAAKKGKTIKTVKVVKTVKTDKTVKTVKTDKLEKIIPDGPHEAIRPTHFELKDLEDNWSHQDKQIYRLIWVRAIQSIMSDCKGEERIIEIEPEADKDFLWEAKCRRTTFQGWRRIGFAAVSLDSDDEEEDDSSWSLATSLQKGDSCSWSQLQAIPIVSKAVGRFNEATLVRELEKKGIGRPSTYASLIGTILDKEFVGKQTIPATKRKFKRYTLVSGQPIVNTEEEKLLPQEKDKLVPSEKGKSVLAFCLKEFPQLFTYSFTAQMEARLDSVSNGESDYKEVCRETWLSYKDEYERLKSAPELSKGTSSGISKGTYKGEHLLQKKGPYGFYVECCNVKVPYYENDTEDTLGMRVAAKIAGASLSHTLDCYEFRKGPYGMFMFKKSSGNTKPQFVSLPEGLDPKILTLEAADRIYKNGLEAAKAGGGGRGGGRGRGRGRGRGGCGGRGSGKA